MVAEVMGLQAMQQDAGPAPRRTRLLAAVFAIMTLSACGPSSDDKDRLAVAKAIDELRAVPADHVEDRRRLANALASLDVQSAAAKKARDACAKAYGALAESMRLTAVASAGLVPSSTADPKETLQALSDAEVQRNLSEDSITECADASAALRAHH
jgi:hypothetical protein